VVDWKRGDLNRSNIKWMEQDFFC